MDRNPIERHRRARGLRQTDLAERVGVSDYTILKWEDGAMPRANRMPQLAEVLGVEPLALQDELDRWIAARMTKPAPARPKRRRRVDLPKV